MHGVMPGMNARDPITQAPRRAPRSDGAEARHRLLHTALRLFAQKGFAKTSTREIAREAEVNISAISYYFGDKEGLYTATFCEPMGGDSSDLIVACNAPGQSLETTLRLCMVSMIDPLKQGEIVRQCIQLHMREMLEPTSRWAEELERDIKGPHRAIADLLCATGFGESTVTVLEALGGPRERVRSSRANGFNLDLIDSLNTVAVEAVASPGARGLCDPVPPVSPRHTDVNQT